MTAILLTVHSLIVLALIVVVLLQRSDGGALGIGGGGGGGGGFMTGRGAANALTRTTSILAALFFATSLALAIQAGGGEDTDSLIDELTSTGGAQESQPEDIDTPPSTSDLLDSLDVEESQTGTDEPASTTDLLESLGAEAPEEAQPVTNEPSDVQPAAETEPASGEQTTDSQEDPPQG
ncbi:preprotein translocase subunit SecG [Hyphococcus flavus]|uniref:Protein-export membrane protein SecG n=1 Tax=Hyphococcus flavus TaxID=1866326 RepID=A0AAF0CF29_9PROT|nr:preprotein translocase subunit SecG [Hyphococcus flavus]WDI30959.1 preprotein translocase subunit SecG [Hyphococcus flavus]